MLRPYPTALYHVTPLHYAPFLLATGTLFCHRELRERGLPLSPRRTAARRDRKLRLDGYVHLSLQPVTPLLRDKLAKGYPHVLIAFDADLLNRVSTALCPYNHKAWLHREAFAPVTDPVEKARLLGEWQGGRYPSAEVLVPDALPLKPDARELLCASEWERDWLVGLLEGKGATALPVIAAPERFPEAAPFDLEPFERYAEECQKAGTILPPPDLPFD